LSEANPQPVLTVSEFLETSRTILENRFSQVSICGEITNLKIASSGHMYFSLKDEKGRVDCAFFRGFNQALAFKPGDGLQVVVGGTATIYAARGQFQLTIRWMEPQGLGGLQLAFEQLKQKLFAEGLFDAARKRPLPRFPKQVAVITSAEGAAWKDFLRILETRVGIEEVDLMDVRVQGAEAPKDIVEAFRRIADWPEYDVVVLTRGGGSAEDLAAFNNESVVRAVAACPIPVLCGVGHEIDTTLCDFAADKRAPTPTAAAEWLAPGRDEIEGRLEDLKRRLKATLLQTLETNRAEADLLTERLAEYHPTRRLDEVRRRVDDLSDDMEQALRHQRVLIHERWANACKRLQRNNPMMRLGPLQEKVETEEKNLRRVVEYFYKDSKAVVKGLEGRLEALQPLAPLKRGYALVTRVQDGKILKSTEGVSIGEHLHVRLAQGALETEVLQKDAQVDKP
jgi:exodeoxyribonuclease VII large subunit